MPRNRGMTLIETVILVGVAVLFLYLAFGKSASAQSSVDIDPRVPIFTTGVTIGPWTGGSSWPHTGVGFGIHHYDHSDNGTVSKFMDWRTLQAHRVHAAAVELVDSMHFAFDSSELGEALDPFLDDLARIMVENPEVSLTLEGHTDLVGSNEYNEILSYRRAYAIFNALVERGVSAERMTFDGFGESEPIDRILGESSVNRRVDLIPSFDLP